MNELHSSRREVMRALVIVTSIIATPVAASAATGLVCTPTASQDPAWLALLEDERRAAAAARRAGVSADEAFSRFSNARSAVTPRSGRPSKPS
ncbi:hypothetical protein VVT58_01945 [Sphingobium sp. SJ10-10]|uniref:hypothetical protein n=1 Tax=Sphingobium sp. SJ10-10 TaxID=3114999 RepID=UPI002E9AC80E|nr:hypothetical protein [Sphingobium sp. SJ10-10]